MPGSHSWSAGPLTVVAAAAAESTMACNLEKAHDEALRDGAPFRVIKGIEHIYKHLDTAIKRYAEKSALPSATATAQTSMSDLNYAPFNAVLRVVHSLLSISLSCPEPLTAPECGQPYFALYDAQGALVAAALALPVGVEPATLAASATENLDNTAEKLGTREAIYDVIVENDPASVARRMGTGDVSVRTAVGGDLGNALPSPGSPTYCPNFIRFYGFLYSDLASSSRTYMAEAQKRLLVSLARYCAETGAELIPGIYSHGLALLTGVHLPSKVRSSPSPTPEEKPVVVRDVPLQIFAEPDNAMATTA